MHSLYDLWKKITTHDNRRLSDLRRLPIVNAQIIDMDKLEDLSDWIMWKANIGEACMGDVNRPQADPKPGVHSITNLVIADLEKRRAMGTEKYGTELRSHNGRDALVDAYQEAQDLVLYLRQALEERHPPADKPHDLLEDALDMRNLYVRPGRIFFVDGPSREATILEEAQSLVHGPRGEHYGHPLDDMTRTAEAATGYFKHKLRDGARFIAEDISKFMILVKLSREMNHPKRDNRVDGSGYFETLDMQIAERQRRVALGQKEWELRPGEDRA